MVNIGVLVSGGGTNLQAVIDNINSGKIENTKVVLVVSNRSDAFALERAKKHNITALFLDSQKYSTTDEYYEQIINEMEKHNVNLVCLAGFLLKLNSGFIRKYKGKIMNIHPALLPSFGGKGMYGHFVHEAVLKSGVRFSGCTVHFVDEKYDCGPIILQAVVPVEQDDTPDSLAKRILVQEHRIYSEAISLFAKGKLKIKDRRVIIGG